MKVKELIERLQGVNPEAEIKFKMQSEDCYIANFYVSYKCKDDEGNEYDVANTYQVTVELDDICDSCFWFEDGECEAYDKPANRVGCCFQYQKR